MVTPLSPKMVQSNAHASSVMAANTIVSSGGLKRGRDKVIAFAKTQPKGFIDDELIDHYNGWDTPSSLRKRRTDLFQEGNLFMLRGIERLNRNNRLTAVWVHVDFVGNYQSHDMQFYQPSLTASAKKERDATVAYLQAQGLKAVAEAIEAGRHA